MASLALVRLTPPDAGTAIDSQTLDLLQPDADSELGFDIHTNNHQQRRIPSLEASMTDITIPSLFTDVVAERDAKYNQKIAKILMDHFRVSKHDRLRLLRVSENLYDEPVITVDLFLRCYPTFPMILWTEHFPGIYRNCSVADLFANFDNTAMVKCYEEIWRECLPADPGKPFGLVIDWPHTKSGGGLVLHNHPIDVRVFGSRLLWICKYGQLVLEPLNVLLDSIDNAAPGGKGWQPEFCDGGWL